MKRENKIRALIKFAFWSVLSCAFLCLAFYLHKSGKFAEWFYFRASEDGYAINALSIMDATVEKPIALAVGQFDRIDGDRAVRVRKGDRLPVNANGVITDKVLKESEQAVFEGAYVLVKIPWKMQDAKGFKYKDTF
jgi:hypothetical protein